MGSVRRKANDNKMKFISMHRLFAFAGGRACHCITFCLFMFRGFYDVDVDKFINYEQLKCSSGIAWGKVNALTVNLGFLHATQLGSSKMFAYVTNKGSIQLKRATVKPRSQWLCLACHVLSTGSIFSLQSPVDVHK